MICFLRFFEILLNNFDLASNSQLRTNMYCFTIKYFLMTNSERKSIHVKGRKSIIEVPEELNDFMDETDPLFESDAEDYLWENIEDSKAYGTGHEQDHKTSEKHETTNKMRLNDFRGEVDKILRTYISDENPVTVQESLRHLNCPLYHDDFVYRTLSYALLGESEDENRAVAVLLTLLHDANSISTEQMLYGFERCLDEIPYLPASAADGFAYFVDCGSHDRFLPAYYRSRHAETVLAALSPETLAADFEDATNNLPSFSEQVNHVREYKKMIKHAVTCIVEGGSFEETSEIIRSANEIVPNGIYMKHEFIRRCIQTGFESSNRQREFISSTLSALVDAGVVTSEDITIGFLRALSGLENSSLDAPTAQLTYCFFVLRAIVDDLLPPAFVARALRLRFGGRIGRSSMRKAQRYLERAGFCLDSRLGMVWIADDSTSSAYATFKETVRDSLSSYFAPLSLKDSEADTRLGIASRTSVAVQSMCELKETMNLNQGAELVRKILVGAMEAQCLGAEAASTLIGALFDAHMLCEEDLQVGVDEIWDRMNDLKLDIPAAPKLVRKLEKYLKDSAIVRKRFRVRSSGYRNHHEEF